MTWQEAIDAHPGCPVHRASWETEDWIHAHPNSIPAEEDKAANDWQRAAFVENNVIPID